MDNPRAEKVAVVDEVREHFGGADAAILTEYRGLKVKELAELRRSLRSSGGEYKIYKNTLVTLAARAEGFEGLEPLLNGPTAIAFVKGDAAAVAKTLRDYSRTNPLLVIKGGVLGEKIIDAKETNALAELPSREQMLAQLAGGLAAPLRTFAGLLQALPRDLAYGLAALRDKLAEGQPAAEAVPVEAEDETATAEAAAAPVEAETATAEAETPAAETPAAETPAAEAPAAETPVAENPLAEAPAEATDGDPAAEETE